MTPVLVAPPVAFPIEPAAMRAYLRVDHTDEDALINGLIASATAHLDGWSGILGRCIMPQSWKVTAEPGEIILPMPDVTSASAAYTAGASALTITATALGPCVTITEACDVTFICAMPDHLLPAAQAAIKLLAGHWYATREAVSTGMAETPLTVEVLVAQLRWRQV